MGYGVNDGVLDDVGWFQLGRNTTQRRATYIWNPAGSSFVLKAPPAAICICEMGIVRDL